MLGHFCYCFQKMLQLWRVSMKRKCVFTKNAKQRCLIVKLVSLWNSFEGEPKMWNTPSRFKRNICKNKMNNEYKVLFSLYFWVIIVYIDIFYSVSCICVWTSVRGLSSQQGPELFGPSSVRVDALLQHRHLGGFTPHVPLRLNERCHVRRLVTENIWYSTCHACIWGIQPFYLKSTLFNGFVSSEFRLSFFVAWFQQIENKSVNFPIYIWLQNNHNL